MKKNITPANYATDANIEKETKAFLSNLNNSGGQPMETMAPADARKVLEGAQQSVRVDLSGISITQQSINQDGSAVNLTIVRPDADKGILPVMMFYHGGGWVIGDFETHRRFIRDLVVYSGVAAVYVDYSRSPEARYPQALHECYAACKWISENGATLQLDGTRMAVVGNSAGGNLAMATALMALAKKGPAIKLQVLFWPVANANLETDSYQQFATDRFLTQNMMRWFWDHYAPDPSIRNEIYASPLQASAEQLSGLPPTLIQTAENDVLRDEGEAYGRLLNEAGVPVTTVRYLGMIHDYGLLNPLAHIPAIQSALRYAASEIRFALR